MVIMAFGRINVIFLYINHENFTLCLSSGMAKINDIVKSDVLIEKRVIKRDETSSPVTN